MGFVKNRLKIVAVVGPTASGKSALAVELAKKFNGVIISADSRQVYKDLDIGTAKIPKAQRGGIPHHMLDVVEVQEDFNVSQYQKEVYVILDEIRRHNATSPTPQLPILVGGTGLYIDAVLQGFDFSGAAPNPALRKKLEAQPLAKLVAQLQKLEPNTTVDLKNPRRVIRRLEILLGGAKVATKKDPQLEALKIGVGYDMEKVGRNIAKRIGNMDIKKLATETKRLIAAGVDFATNPLTALYYRPMQEYLLGKVTETDLRTKLILGDRQYAKRQLTWFRRDKSIIWAERATQAEKAVKEWLRSPSA